MNDELNYIWEAVKRFAAEKMSTAAVRIWLEEAEIISLEDGVLTLYHPKEFYTAVIEAHHVEMLIRGMKELFGLDVSVALLRKL